MGLADQARSAWNRMTGKPEPQPARQPEAAARSPERKPDPPAHKDRLREVPQGAPGPAARAFPSHAQELRQERQPPNSPTRPVEREATKMEYTRTAQPAPSPGGSGYVNRTSTFQRGQQDAKAPARDQPAAPAKAPDNPARKSVSDFQRDNQAADRQQAADKAGAGEQPGARFRRPGQAPFDQTYRQAAERTNREQRTVEQFKRPEPDQSRSR